jgi:hypothetical protein
MQGMAKVIDGTFRGADRSNLAAPTEAAVRQTQVSQELGELQDCIEVLDKCFNGLADRLSPITRISPVGEAEKLQTEEPLVPMASLIREKRKQIEHIIGNVQYVLANIEL